MISGLVLLLMGIGLGGLIGTMWWQGHRSWHRDEWVGAIMLMLLAWALVVAGTWVFVDWMPPEGEWGVPWD